MRLWYVKSYKILKIIISITTTTHRKFLSCCWGASVWHSLLPLSSLLIACQFLSEENGPFCVSLNEGSSWCQPLISTFHCHLYYGI